MSFSIFQNKTTCTAILFIGASLIIGSLCITFIPQFEVISDFADYDTIALTLKNEHAYIPISTEKIIYPPLYPIFLTFIYSVAGHSYAAVFIVQFALLGLSSFLTFKITRDTLNLPYIYSFLAGSLVLLWPYLILYSQLISSEILFIALILSTTTVSLAALRANSLSKTAISGILFALAALTRPVSLLLPLWICAIVIVFIFLKYRIYTHRALLYSSVGLGTFFVTLIPWILFASITFNTFIPVASNFKNVFDKGNKTFEYLDASDSPTEGSPHGTLGTLILAKATNIYMFWDPGAGGYQAEKLISVFPIAKYAVTLYKMIFFIMLTLAILAFFEASRKIYILGIIILYFWSVHTVLFPSPRYMLPVIPFVVMLALKGLRDVMVRSKFHKIINI